MAQVALGPSVCVAEIRWEHNVFLTKARQVLVFRSHTGAAATGWQSSLAFVLRQHVWGSSPYHAGGNLRNYIHPRWTCLDVTTYPATGGASIVSLSGQVGLNNTGDLPPGVAGLFSLETGSYTRRNRGRVFMPYPGAGYVASSRPHATYKAGVDLWLTNLINGLKSFHAAQYGLVVWSRAGGYVRDVTSVVPADRFSDQPRRGW